MRRLNCRRVARARALMAKSSGVLAAQVPGLRGAGQHWRHRDAHLHGVAGDVRRLVEGRAEEAGPQGGEEGRRKHLRVELLTPLTVASGLSNELIGLWSRRCAEEAGQEGREEGREEGARQGKRRRLELRSANLSHDPTT